jgi:hypothetical protein
MGRMVLGAPDDLDAVIRDFIGDAKHSLAVAVQKVDSRSIAEAILAARARAVRVQVILEGDYLMEAHPSADPWTAAGYFEENRVIHAAFLRAGVDVITDLNPAIFPEVRRPRRRRVNSRGTHGVDELHPDRHRPQHLHRSGSGQQPEPRGDPYACPSPWAQRWSGSPAPSSPYPRLQCGPSYCATSTRWWSGAPPPLMEAARCPWKRCWAPK